MYSDPMWATANRQNHLYETKYFRCKCPRCTDPTELGTEFSFIKCQTCPVDRHGYLAAIGMNIFFFERQVYPRKKIACKEEQLLRIRIKIIFAPFFFL